MSVKTALLLLSFCCISFAQKSNQQKITIFLDINDKALKEYYIDKDTTTAFFNILNSINKCES
jgi:hypothetical protein